MANMWSPDHTHIQLCTVRPLYLPPVCFKLVVSRYSTMKTAADNYSLSSTVCTAVPATPTLPYSADTLGEGAEHLLSCQTSTKWHK